MSVFEDLQDRAARLLGKVTLIDASQADAVGTEATGTTYLTGGSKILGALSSIWTAFQAGTAKADTRVSKAASGGALQDTVAVEREGVIIYSAPNNITALTSSPYTADTTLYNTYNNPNFATLAGHFAALILDIFAILVGGTATATATIFLQAQTADGAWVTFYTETIGTSATGVTSYIIRRYVIGRMPQIVGQANGTQVISVNGTNQTFTNTGAVINNDVGINFRWQITYSGAGAALTLFNQSLIGKT